MSRLRQDGRPAMVCAAWAGILLLLSPNSPAGEKRPLFNGRDTSGWRVIDGAPDDWTVTDGCLHPARAGGWLSTEREYADFELELEFELAPGSNSGVFFRSPHEGRISRTGNEIQLIDDFTNDYGPLEPWQLTGSLYHVAAAAPGAARPAGEWQTLGLRAVGSRLAVTLNARGVLDVDLAGYPQLQAEHPGLTRPRGYLGLQNYGGRMIRFRRIELGELP